MEDLEDAKMVRCFSVGGTAQVEQSGDKVRDKIEDVAKKDMQRVGVTDDLL